MPDKPKRRKNNKNKRKNKNNNWQHANKNNSDVKEVPSNEECSVSSSQTEIICGASDLSTNSALNENLCENLNKTNSDAVEITVEPPSPSNKIAHKVDNDFNSEKVLKTKLNNKTEGDTTQIKIEEPYSDLTYMVESPEQSTNCVPKLIKTVKSKSLDNDDDPKIIEITENHDDDHISVVDCSNVLVSEVESDVEWETADNLQVNTVAPSDKVAAGKLSITCIPLSVAQCDQNKSLTPEEELNLRQYLNTLNLTTEPPHAEIVEINAEIEEMITREVKQRLRKKGHTEDFVQMRQVTSRHLDVIDEESGESSLASRRQSYLSEKKSDNDDLDDDVFEEKVKPNKRLEKCPPAIKIRNKNLGRRVPQECVLVDAKIKDPDGIEARGDWSLETVQKISGAEIVYLTDSSSSTSSVYDLNEDMEEDVETDSSVRMITPTIEVTDTEKLLKESFLRKNVMTHDNGDTKSPTNNDKSKSEGKTNNQVNGNSKSNESIEQNPHEIVVLSTDNIKTSLYVKELENENVTTEGHETNNVLKASHQSNATKDQKHGDLDMEMKVLKCETNTAFNNLINEYISDTENNDNPKDQFTRQDSSSSIGSSQCTAKYNPTSSSLNDVSNILHDEMNATSKKYNEHSHIDIRDASHVKDVFECVTGQQLEKEHDRAVTKEPLHLRDLCVKRIANFPFGDKILEELASVSERLQSINIYGSSSSTLTANENHTEHSRKTHQESNNMPYYPLPDVSAIGKVSLPTKSQRLKDQKPKDSAPPPIQPRNSSLKISQEDSHWTGLPTQQDPVYVCLSPSQKMLMEKTNTIITKEDASQLVDMHKKYVDRRGYNEYYDKTTNHDKKTFSDPPAIPFKSQTGSRLLALIRDPAVTNNIHSSQRKSYQNSSVDQLQKSYECSESRYAKKFENFKSAKDIPHNFKPIPPPRPKKISSHLYESDESSDFTDNSLRSVKSERKFFHYSTGNLSKEIENDVSSIQDMHRRYVNVRESVNKLDCPRRPSLPKDLCEQQMEYIRMKEKEVEAEIRRLEQQKLNFTSAERKGPRAPLVSEKEVVNEQYLDSDNYHISRKRDVSFTSTKSPERGEKRKISSLFSSSQEELQRDKMYSEYMSQMAERQERKQQKIIKITNTSSTKSKTNAISKSMSALNILDSKTNNPIEKEFICKARERWNKLGIKDPETEDEKDDKTNVYHEPTPKVIEHRIKVIECGEERDVHKLPSHLQEFVQLTAKDKEKGTSSPGESSAGPTTPHVILCAVLIIVFAIVKAWMRLLRNK